jgi:hypothetical protein
MEDFGGYSVVSFDRKDVGKNAGKGVKTGSLEDKGGEREGASDAGNEVSPSLDVMYGYWGNSASGGGGGGGGGILQFKWWFDTCAYWQDLVLHLVEVLYACCYFRMQEWGISTIPWWLIW